MNRENFIESLTAHLATVKRIYPAWITFIIWTSFSFFTTLVFVWSRSENFKLIHSPHYQYDLVFIFLSVISSAFIAIYTSVPGNRMKGIYLYAPIAFLSFWIVSILLRFFLNIEFPMLQNLSYHHCGKDLLLMSIPSASILIYILNRRVPMKRNWIGLWIVTASLSMSALGIAFLCPNENPTHTLLLHALPIILVGLMGTFLGRYIFRGKY